MHPAATAPDPAGATDWLEPLGHGIHAIDTGFTRARFDAAYLIVEEGRAAFIDNGTQAALDRLLGALDRLGVSRAAVDWVIVTHVHLDHAGATGHLMAQLPQARLVVHPRGARHMIDPSALLEGARAVYGAEEVARTYGELRPVDPARVHETQDGMSLPLAGRPLLFIDTPGHARHHHCVWDERSRGWFTGDTFGLSYPELEAPGGRYLLPSTTPVQFEPEPLKHSIGRMLAREPDCMYLTHYGRVDGVARLGAQLLEQIDEMVDIARSAAGSGADADRPQRLEAALGRLYRGRLRALGSLLTEDQIDALLEVDVRLNAQGLGVWLDRLAAKP